MRYIFNFPDIGEGLEEGIIVKWLVKKGQSVDLGEPLVTMETDKVVTDIPSPKKGILVELFGKPGETIKVGDALVEIDIAGIKGKATISELNEESSIEVVEEEGAGVVGTLEISGNNAILTSSDEGLAKDQEKQQQLIKKVLATPVARAMAKDFGLDINKIRGTGPAGRVMKENILNYREKSGSPVSEIIYDTKSEQTKVDIEPLSQIRKTIAKNMLYSKNNAAHMSLFEEVEISELERIKNKYKAIYAQNDIKLTYLAFIIKATALALKKHRTLNAELDLENSNMIYKKYYNIGIAVDTEKGLMVPVIKNADKLSIREIAKQAFILSDKARKGKLTLEEMKNGTFTLTSYGSIGGLFAVPVINFPQAGILGVGRISKKPIVTENAIVPGLILPLSLSVDHRIADGGETSRFINSLMEYLHDPISLIME